MSAEVGVTAEVYKTIVTIVDERVKEIKVTRENFNELRAAMEKLAKAQARTEGELGTLTAAFEGLKTEVKSLSDTVGLGLEDLGSAVLPSYIERTYGISAVTFSRKFITIDGKGIEINLYAEGKREGETIILLGEAKNRIRKAEVSKYVKRITALKDYFDKPLFLFMFGYWIHPSAEELAKDNGIELIVTYKLTR